MGFFSPSCQPRVLCWPGAAPGRAPPHYRQRRLHDGPWLIWISSLSSLVGLWVHAPSDEKHVNVGYTNNITTLPHLPLRWQ